MDVQLVQFIFVTLTALTIFGSIIGGQVAGIRILKELPENEKKRFKVRTSVWGLPWTDSPEFYRILFHFGRVYTGELEGLRRRARMWLLITLCSFLCAFAIVYVWGALM
jgi:hypothetical protein